MTEEPAVLLAEKVNQFSEQFHIDNGCTVSMITYVTPYVNQRNGKGILQ